MVEFSFSHFRSMLSVIRRGEVREEIDAEGLLGSSSDKLSPTAKRVFSGVLLVVLCLVLFGGGCVTASASDLDIIRVFFMMVASLVVLVVVMGFYQAVNMLYFVKDLNFYLALPVSAVTIMGAKLAYYILSQVAINCVVVSFGLGFLAGRGADPASFVILILAFLPCVIATALALIIIVIPVMRFSRIAADKDKFARVFGTLATIVSVLVAFAVNLVTRSASSSTMSSLGDAASHGIVGVVLAVVCAPTLLISEVFAGNVVLGLVGMYALALIYVAVTALFAKKWYFEGVRSIQGGSGKKSRKRYSAGELAGAVKQRGQFKAFLAQDVANLVRVPAFFQQFVLPMFIGSLGIALIGVVSIYSKDAEEFNEISGLLLTANVDANTYLALVFALMAIGIFSCLTSHLFSFALGRDGEDFFFLRAMPLNMRDYVASKFASGYLIARVPVFVVLLVAAIVVGIPVDAAVVAVLACALPLTAVDLLMFAIGSKKPRLAWENEAQLCRQSDATLYMFIAFIVGIVAFALPGMAAFMISLLGISGYVGAFAIFAIGAAEVAGAGAFVLMGAPDNMERVRR